MSDDRKARRKLAALPGFTAERAESARLTRLAGLTNLVFKVEQGGDAFCLRIPGVGTDSLIDRRAEEANARAAAAAGVAPEVLHFADDGTMLTPFLKGAPLTPARLSESPGALHRAAAAFRRLHQDVAEFANVFRAFETIERYVALLAENGTAPSDQHGRVVAEGKAVRAALSASPTALRPCHCDPTGRNLIDTGERVWLVDWEYGGMNDPMWDLAYFSIESGLDEPADRDLLTAYFGRPPRESDAARMAVTKPACELLAATWALIQDSQGNRTTDFSAYADRMFGRAAERMARSEFGRQVEALRRG